MRPPVFRRLVCVSLLVIIPVMGEEKPKVSIATGDADAGDIAKQLQARAIEEGKADFGYWGTDPNKYTGWTTHSNRLIPVYTFGTKGAGAGIDLDSYAGDNSLYRSEDKVQALYGYVPERTINPNAVWMDQTNIADLQRAAAAAGPCSA